MDARIAAAFADDAKSADVSRLLPEVEAAAQAADAATGEARSRALDPLLSRDDVKLARRDMEDAVFTRDRLHEARTKLAERIEALKALDADPTLGLRGRGVNELDAQPLGDAAELGQAVAALRLFGVEAENAVPIRIDGQRQRRIGHGGCGLAEIARIGFDNQILHEIRYLRHIRQPAMNNVSQESQTVN